MKSTIETLKAVADRNRLRIILALTRHEELCACQITELLSVTGATASRHLSILQSAGWIDSRKEGRWHYFRLTATNHLAPILQWLTTSTESSADMQADEATLNAIVTIKREDLCRKQRGVDCCP